MNQNSLSSERVVSLDILRGFDIFCLVALGPFLVQLVSALGWRSNPVAQHLFHVDWIGLFAWDLVMPLFIFMAGVSIPLAVASHRKKGWGDTKLWLRLLRRFLILWLLGMTCQGNLLALNFDRIYLFSNTLQSIAIGALIATPIIMYTTRIRTRLMIMLAFMIAYSCIFNFVSVEGISAGSYAKVHNIAEWLDRAVLGRFVDGAHLTKEGNVAFSPYYNYAWILGSLNMAALTLAGAIGGTLLLSHSEQKMKLKNMLFLIVFFALCFVIFKEPCIKKLFTSSFTALTASISFALLALFYFIFDMKKWGSSLFFLRIYGGNAIMAYLLFSLIPAGTLSKLFFYGFGQYLGNFYPLLLTTIDALILFLLLYALDKLRIYLRA